ncbi:ECF transporter S component [Curtobacterium sp. Leaf261]|uniref:ECF transporter S component n=1 Tax=Curtobacterium sp. Leaf261 TaxID=1736311 RepID=UPI0009EA6407|nr:ECF transporter S component [Curtobacterium sp. Leaf261]
MRDRATTSTVPGSEPTTTSARVDGHGDRGGRRPRSLRWRVVDIVVASVLAVAAGLVFTLWDLGYAPISAGLQLVLPGMQSLVGGVWLLAGVLVGIVVRKPGAALYGELVAATVEALMGNVWGPMTLESGLVQGLGAELVLAIFLYRSYRLPVVMLAGAVAGLALGFNDLVFYYAGYAPAFSITYVVCAVLSGAVVAGIGSWLLVRALARTGVLSGFAVGRELRADRGSSRRPSARSSRGRA